MKTKKKLSVLLICVTAALCLVCALSLGGCKNDDTGDGSDSGISRSGENDDLKFYLSGSEYQVIGMISNNSDIVIPSEFNGLPVTAIGRRAFYENTIIRSVVIPDSVISIDYSAFYGCENLESVTMSRNLFSIGDHAFSFCSSLTSIELPSSLVSISDYAFWYCESLESINISNGTRTIGYVAFSRTAITSIVIPDSVTTIGDSAFSSCPSLTSVTIGEGVTTIGAQAFYSCTSLTAIYYTGSPSDWSNVSMGDSNGWATTLLYYYSETEPEDDGKFWHYVNGEIVVWSKY
ncbi:MAG: leucine-rich repeat domain-containing protein [Bacteroidales bacterium]|nr:leucine-rich repeat domain-containing protein [Bacteroidales bacterium]